MWVKPQEHCGDLIWNSLCMWLRVKKASWMPVSLSWRRAAWPPPAEQIQSTWSGSYLPWSVLMLLQLVFLSLFPWTFPVFHVENVDHAVGGCDYWIKGSTGPSYV